MALTLTDQTASSKVLSSSNSSGVELGAGTASTGLSVQGRTVFNGATLTPNTLPSGAVARVTGVVSITSRSSVDVIVGPCAGFGVISGAVIYQFLSDGRSLNRFSAALLTPVANVTRSCSYAVF